MKRGCIAEAGHPIDSEAVLELHLHEAGHIETFRDHLLALQLPFYVALAVPVQLLKLFVVALFLELLLVTPATRAPATPTDFYPQHFDTSPPEPDLLPQSRYLSRIAVSTFKYFLSPDFSSLKISLFSFVMVSGLRSLALNCSM